MVRHARIGTLSRYLLRNKGIHATYHTRGDIAVGIMLNKQWVCCSGGQSGEYARLTKCIREQRSELRIPVRDVRLLRTYRCDDIAERRE